MNVERDSITVDPAKDAINRCEASIAGKGRIISN